MKKSLQHFPLVSISLLFLMIGTGCRKNSTGDSKAAAPAVSGNEEMVRTPMGLVERSKVHFIAEDYRLSVVNGRLQKLEKKTGRMIEDFGEAKPNEPRFNLKNFSSHPSGTIPASADDKTVTGTVRNNQVPAPASGWIADASWTNYNTGNPITLFTTSWVVPPAPANPSGQTLFLFNGMQDGLTSTSYIIQPVLQWGGSAAGGGQYWSITNWYVSSSQVFFGPLITVNAGTPLQGVMQQVANSGSSYNYVSYFSGYSPALEIDGLPQPTWAAETLEAYGVTDENSQYPPDNGIAMYGIQILQGNTNANLSWSTGQATAGSALKAVVVSNSSPGGQVNIYFR